GTVYGGSVSSNFKTLLSQNSYKGPGATQGAVTREGCNVCNPIFGQTVVPSQCSCKLTHTDTASGQFGAGGGGDNCTNVITTTVQTDSDLFHDIDPLRSAKEAVKNFAARLDPKFDQIGFVSFTDNVRDEWRAELQCIRWATKNDPDGVKGCYDPTSTPISYTTVIREVEDTDNTSSTNIAEGMREGLEELGIGDGVNSHDCATGIDDGSVCDRRGAARRILILMTDGSPNANDNCSAPGLADLWQGNPGSGDKDYTCAMYYARIAANNNVTVYTIGIGSGVNRDLMTAMATGTDPTTGIEYFTERGGKYYPAANPSQLDAIFQQILSNVFVRIIG
nr:vWA domain-containing protein [Anaerolineae bacterium]